MYYDGKGVEKDENKEIHHLEEAAVGGHPYARCIVGDYEWCTLNVERAVKHWIIAATLGHDDAIKALMEKFKMGYVSKEELATALRAHQAAVDAMKSPQREAAKKKCVDYSTFTFSKEDFAAALRAHQAAVDATKIPKRKAIEKNRRCSKFGS